MRKLLPLTLLLLPAICLAQKNAVKVNLSSLLLNNYHIQYERKILPKITVNLGFRYMPKSGLPLEETLNKYGGLDDPSLKLGEFEMGNTAITIEPRLYLSKKALKGFYIAPYARMATFDLNLPFSYSYDSDPGPGVTTTTKTATFVGKIKSTSGGLMFGTQFSIAKKLALDIWWVGGHYGSSTGDLAFNVALPTQEERDAVKNTLNDFDPSPFEFESTVTAQGATIKSTGPWAGIRMFGINLGIKF